jgi:amino acid transporter
MSVVMPYVYCLWSMLALADAGHCLQEIRHLRTMRARGVVGADTLRYWPDVVASSVYMVTTGAALWMLARAVW